MLEALAQKVTVGCLKTTKPQLPVDIPQKEVVTVAVEKEMVPIPVNKNEEVNGKEGLRDWGKGR